MQQTDTEFTLPIRIYYEDTDVTGLVYNAVYPRFMERARVEWLREVGFSQTCLMDSLGMGFVVRRIEIDYFVPARFDDLISVHSRLVRLGGASMTFDQQVKLGDTLLCRGLNKIGCVAYPETKPMRMPQDLYQQMKKYVV